MSQFLENECSQVPVTALTLAFNAIVFAGQGPYLKVYARASSELLWITRIFATQAIHGFAQTPRDANSGLSLLVWGGRSVCYCEVTVEESNKSRLGITVSITRKQVIRTRDWVFDASFRSRKGESLEPVTCAVIVTAHNELLELKVLDRDRSHGDGSALLQLNALFSGPRCGLYSASLSWLSPTQLLIASGTVFGEIVIWSLNSDGSSIEARRNYIFTGHEGSIFGVRISDKTALDDGTELRLLASCSDDRTIRIWNISDLSRGIKLDGEDLSEVERDSSRTTGFLNYVSEEAVTASKDLCVAVDMGHLSRIWDIRFAIERQDKGYISTIISVGEDATCQKWDLSYTGLEQTTFALSHIASNGYHEGKSIWSLATSDVSACPLVFTGGSDGKIVQHSSLVASHTTETQHLQLSEWVIEDCLSALGNQDSPEMPITESRNGEISRTQPKLTKGKEKQDCFRSFACIGDSQLLLTTNDGLVLLATCTGAKQWAWKRIGSFGGLKGYSVACRLTAEPFEYVFFGDGRGNIYYYHSFFEEIKILTNIDGKVTKLMAEILPPKTHEYMSIVVTRHGGLPPVQLRVNLGTAGNLHVSTTKVFANWKEDSAPITSSCVVIHDSVEKGLIVGCRDGTIYSYSQPASASKREFDFELPFSHGKEAVTALVWKSHKGVQYNIWDPTFGWLFSVGRDGTLAVHFFPGYYENPYLVHRLALSFGPNLEGLAIDPHTSDVSVWGFTSKFFVCHNVSAMQDVVTVECGGAHRIWTFGPFEASTGLFAWVKASKLNVAKVNSASHEVMQSGGHGREIKACAVAPKSIVPGLGPLIATGSEDTNIAICYYADWHGSQKELKPLSVLRKHVTGIQALHWSSDGNFLFSSGGFEEFYVWHLRAVPAVTVGIVCESKCPLDSADSELRITDFAVRDISVCERMSRGDWMWVFLISMVYSNSSIKVWKYTCATSPLPDREAWSFVGGTQYTTSCLTTAAYLSASSSGWPLVTGSTDGHLAFWSLTDMTRQLTCHKVQSLHQSSVKAIATAQLTDSCWLVISAGDDNALGCTVLTFDDETAEYTSSSLIVLSAHAAAVTAVGILRSKTGSERTKVSLLRIVTASNDQVVKIWTVRLDLRKPGIKGLNVTKDGKYASAVADISSLAVLDGTKGHGEGDEGTEATKILICGVGTEVWAHRRGC